MTSLTLNQKMTSLTLNQKMTRTIDFASRTIPITNISRITQLNLLVSFIKSRFTLGLTFRPFGSLLGNHARLSTSVSFLTLAQGSRGFSSIPAGFLHALKTISVKSQIYYNTTMDLLLTTSITSPIILLWFRFLFLFHNVFQNIHTRFGDNNVNLAALSISMITARLHVGGWLIVVCLIILRLQASFRKVARYYQADMTRLNRDFPHIRMEKRYMKRATEAIVEALENPKTQAVAIAVGGALAWKAMDLWDTSKNAEIAESDRKAAIETADKDRKATIDTADKDRKAIIDTADKDRLQEAMERQKDRDAEDARHRQTLEAEATQRQLDRESATQRSSLNNDENENLFVD